MFAFLSSWGFESEKYQKPSADPSGSDPTAGWWRCCTKEWGFPARKAADFMFFFSECFQDFCQKSWK